MNYIQDAENLGINLRGNSSGEVSTLCPKCSHTRKKSKDLCFNVNLDKGVFKCHHCQWEGGLKSADTQYEPFLKPKVVKQPGEYKPNDLNDLSGDVITFFDSRCISERVLRLEGIKTAKKWLPRYNSEVDCIAFPFIKENRRVNTKYRTAAKDMAQDGNAEKCFYRWDKIKDSKVIYITEGEIDALTLVECGYDIGVTSVPDGAPNPTASNLDNKFSYFNEESQPIFEAAEKVILVVDNDQNGKFLENELKRRIGLDKCLMVNYPEDCKDINDVLIKHGKDKVKQIIESAEHFPVSGLKVFSDYEQDILNLYNGVTGEFYKTGWMHFDRHLKIKTGQLNIVTGVPGSGKSEWLDALMMNTVAQYGLKWAVFSPENYPVQVYFSKLAEKYKNKSFKSFKDHDIKNSIDDLSKNIKLIVDNESDDVTMDYLFERIKVLVFRHGIKGVIIDPWNEITHTIGAREDLYLNQMLRRIKRFIRKYDLTFWLVAHPKNPQKDKNGNYYKITAYDIAGGYAWFAKADNVFSVWRNKADNTQPVEVDIQKIKQKTDGQLGICYFYYQYETGKFRSHASSLDCANITKEEIDKHAEEF